jgi:hypothetical protein
VAAASFLLLHPPSFVVVWASDESLTCPGLGTRKALPARFVGTGHTAGGPHGCIFAWPTDRKRMRRDCALRRSLL